jgi:hypothetical protein
MFEIQESSLLLFKRTKSGLSDGTKFLGLGLIFLLVLWDPEDVRGDLGVHCPEGLLSITRPERCSSAYAHGLPFRETRAWIPRTDLDEAVLRDLIHRPILNPHDPPTLFLRVRKDDDRTVHFYLVPQRLEDEPMLNVHVDLVHLGVGRSGDRVGGRGGSFSWWGVELGYLM